MKKIFTLMLAGIATIGMASAQSRDFGHVKQGTVYVNNGNQREIQKINREYDFKITAVKMNRRLNSWEKSRQIRNLENQRDRELNRFQYGVKSHGGFDDSHVADNNHSHKW